MHLLSLSHTPPTFVPQKGYAAELVQSYCRAQKIEELDELVQRIGSEGMQAWTNAMYNAVIKSYTEGRLLEKAEKVWARCF